MKERNLVVSTFMAPSVPVEFYELLCFYLESRLNLHSSLLYDSRRDGPGMSRNNYKDIDIAFVSSHYLLTLPEDSQLSLLPVGAATLHPVKGETLGYFTDIVIRSDEKEMVNDFYSLRGRLWACSKSTSLSSSHQMLAYLKQIGEAGTFFSNVRVSGSHPASLELLLGKKIEGAAVDSLAFSNYLTRYYYHEDDFYRLLSIGPLPPHPILVNKKLPDEVVEQIEESLLCMHEDPVWKKSLEEYSILGFEKTCMDSYMGVQDILSASKHLSFSTAYY